jgi:glycosyltransferase involved in cell wall biosynthesis
MTKISAIICTHNRSQYLGAAIDSLLVQDFETQDPNSFEIVVVDNGSSDRTRAVVEERLPHPRLRYIWEPTLGLSVARNTGARETRSPILAYLDDDAVASPHWLQTLYQTYQNHDRLAVAGGKVILLWPTGVKPPSWLSPGLAGNLGAYDLGETLIDIDHPGLTPRGLNYSIRRTFLESVGGFDPNLGRVGKKLLSNEELMMTEMALHQGWQVVYVPEALVAHNVAIDRLHRSWFLQRGWWQGVSECYREQLSDRADWKQFPRGLERILRGLYNALKYITDPAQRFDNLVYAYSQIGYLSAAVEGLFAPPLDGKANSRPFRQPKSEEVNR